MQLEKNRSEIALNSLIPKYSRDLNAEAIFLVEEKIVREMRQVMQFRERREAKKSIGESASPASYTQL